MNILLGTLLQLALALLVSAQNPNVPADLRAQAVAVANQALVLYQSQSAAQPASTAPTASTVTVYAPWLNITQLANADYTDLAGNKFTLANGVYSSAYNSAQLLEENTSFGDMNGDHLDDAVVVLRTSVAAQPPHIMLAVVVNLNGGQVADLANLDLGRSVQIFDHRVQNQRFKLDLQADNGPREVRLYELRGDKLVLVDRM